MTTQRTARVSVALQLSSRPANASCTKKSFIFRRLPDYSPGSKLVFACNSSLERLFVGTYRTVMVPRYCAQRNAVHCSGVSRGLHSTGVTVSLCACSEWRRLVYSGLRHFNGVVVQPLYLISDWQTFSHGDGMQEMGVRVNWRHKVLSYEPFTASVSPRNDGASPLPTFSSLLLFHLIFEGSVTICIVLLFPGMWRFVFVAQ